MQLWAHWNRPEIGSKQHAVNAAHFDHGLEADRAWIHGIHIDIRFEILRGLAKILVHLLDRWILDAFVVQLPVPIESANHRSEGSAHVNEKNLELWVFIEDAAKDHTSCRQRRIKWPAYGFDEPVLLHGSSAYRYQGRMNMNENIFVLRVLPQPFGFGRVEKDLIWTGTVAGRNADAASFFFGNQRINDSTRILFERMSVGHAGNLIGESIPKFERLVVQELERVDGACFNDVLG